MVQWAPTARRRRRSRVCGMAVRLWSGQGGGVHAMEERSGCALVMANGKMGRPRRHGVLGHGSERRGGG